MKWIAIAMAAIFIMAGCVEKKNYPKMEVSISFNVFPSDYTCDGNNTSPEILLSGINENVKSIAIIVIDEDAKNFVHWLIWNIEATPPNMSIPQNIPKKPVVDSPIHAIQGENDFGKIGYGGPCPPPGGWHHYHFKVYGLDSMLDIKPASGINQLEKAMHGHVIQYGEVVAIYRR